MEMGRVVPVVKVSVYLHIFVRISLELTGEILFTDLVTPVWWRLRRGATGQSAINQ